MVIMSVSLIGIYSLVNSGQNLAKTADDGLIASNLAKEWLESIGALRDTFLLRAYGIGDCLFTIDANNLTDSCYALDTKFFLKDDRTLTTDEIPAVCINTDGWYSQESSKTGELCPESPKCGWIEQKECLTGFTRTITFLECTNKGMDECVRAKVTVGWGQWESLTLEQIFTRH